jgi:hypothetical protein
LKEYHEACGFDTEDEDASSTASFTSFLQSQMNWKFNQMFVPHAIVQE